MHWLVDAGSDRLVLRRYGPWRSPAKVLWELELQRRVGGDGWRVPNPVGTPAVVGDHVWAVLPWVAGQRRRPRSDASRIVGQLRRGHLLSELHLAMQDHLDLPVELVGGDRWRSRLVMKAWYRQSGHSCAWTLAAGRGHLVNVASGLRLRTNADRAALRGHQGSSDCAEPLPAGRLGRCRRQRGVPGDQRHAHRPADPISRPRSRVRSLRPQARHVLAGPPARAGRHRDRRRHRPRPGDRAGRAGSQLAVRLHGIAPGLRQRSPVGDVEDAPP
jgi:hypothetical protein